MSKKILITGNHHTPAIELIQQLKTDQTHNWHISYITHSYKSENHIKNSLKPLLGSNLYQISGGKFHRHSIIKTFADLPKTISSIFKSYQLIKHIKPDIVVSFGGYISVPIIISSWLQSIASITHEQTTTLSLSNQINGLFCKKICLSFNNHIPFLLSKKTIVTGNLLRRQIFTNTTKNYKHLIPTIKLKPLVFISGGNQSSSVINQTFLSIANQLTDHYTIIHHTGKIDYEKITSLVKNYKDYLTTAYVGPDDIGWVLNNSQIIINRSGANYCQEIATLKRNSILIPLPFSQQNEQLKNALWLKKQLPKNTIIINQKDLSSQTLFKAINKLTRVKLTATKIKTQINHKLLQLIYQYV